MTRVEKRKAHLRNRIQEQLKWIADHGGDEPGYVARYGGSLGDATKEPKDGGRYGDGGEMIFLADMGALAGYRAELEYLEAGGSWR